MTRPQTVIATWLLGVVAHFTRLGLDPDVLGAGLWTGSLAQGAPTRQYQLVQVRRLWQRAAQLSADPLLGLKVGAALPLQAMNVLALVIIHSGTLRAALGHAMRYQQLVSNSGRFRLVPMGGGLRMAYTVTPSPVPMYAAQIDSLFAGFLGFIYCCMPGAQRPAHVYLPGTDARQRLAYEQILGCPVTLGEPQACIDFDAAMLDAPWDAADAGLLRMLLSRADATLQAQGRSSALVDHVLAAVAAQGYGRATIAAVAGSLDMSARTLQRRLAASQTSLRQLVEAARMDEALLLLADARQPLSMLAERLGYAEPSAFSHAVRSYWGKPPRELRDELARERRQAGAELRISAAKGGKPPGGAHFGPT